MKQFAALLAELDATTRTGEKVAAMASYFRVAAAADAAWAVHFLRGNRPKRLVPVRRLAEWAMAGAEVPEWLFNDCYEAVGDLAETIALLLPDAGASPVAPLHVWIEQRLLPLREHDEDGQRRMITSAWRELGGWERFVWNKLITGGFRIGVSDGLVVRALAGALEQEPDVIAQRLAGSWEPTPDAYTRLGVADTADVDISRPYPFYLASALESEPDALGEPAEWLAEWKWDGIRAQLIRRAGRTFIWSRGGDLITERFPELVEAAALLPDGTVLDGELIGWADGRPLEFSALQRRIGRKRVGAKLLREVPAALIVYDLLEHQGADVRERPLQWRRETAARLLRDGPTALDRFPLSPSIAFDDWSELGRMRDAARDQPAEGVMLKRLDSPYLVGRRRGAWWKWKSAAMTVDAVLIYAQAGHGRRAGLHTDYTFAVWDEGALVPFAKAYTGLNDAEIRRLDAWIRRSTLEKFGPVRSVKPEHVFELAFEGVQRSPRHKSGIAVRFPRIVRWRTDKRPADADSLSTLHTLLGDS